MRRAILIALSVFGGLGHGAAAEATAEGAQGLSDTLHRYLGPARAGQADFVRTEPQGDAYRVALDLDEFARPLEPLGFALDSAELSFLTQPLPDGTWHVSEMQLPSPLTLHMQDQAITYRFDGFSFDGVYDPARAAFTRFDETIGAVNVAADAQNTSMTSSYGTQTVHGTATAAGTDAVDAIVGQSLAGFTGRQSITMPPSEGASAPAAPFELSYKADSAGVDVSVKAMKSPALLDLWAYGVARALESPPVIDNAEIKQLLTDLLPVFQRVEEKGSVAGLHFGTPLGDFGIDSLSASMTLPGVVSNGEMKFAMQLAGPSYPEAVMPGWAKQLVPAEVELGFDLSGFDLDAPARLLIERLDFGRKPPLADADFADAAKLAAENGAVKFTLEPTRIHGSILDVTASGEMSIAMPAPTGSFEVTVTGLDDAIALLKDSPEDPAASQALASLTLVQSLGRQASDGSTSYAIEIKPDGSVSVNGQVLRPPTGNTL